VSTITICASASRFIDSAAAVDYSLVYSMEVSIMNGNRSNKSAPTSNGRTVTRTAPTNGQGRTTASTSTSTAPISVNTNTNTNTNTDNTNRVLVEEVDLKAAHMLLRTILGDDSVTLTRPACYKALEHHVERLSELERTLAKLEKSKGQRDAMSGPLKRLTLQLQTAAKERHAGAKQAAKQEKEMERLRQELKDSQMTVTKLEQQNTANNQKADNGDETSLNLLEDISSNGDEVSPENPWIQENGLDTSSLALLVKEKERKIEILEQYLMAESGVKNPVNYWERQLAFCATSILPEALEKMDETLMQLRLIGVKVDIGTWNNFMKFWACSGLPDAPEKMEGLVEYMRKECVDPDVGTWNQFMTFWAISGSPEAHDKMEALLQGMADDGVTPDVVTWSIFAKTPAKKTGEEDGL
jgi:hypothetical protein